MAWPGHPPHSPCRAPGCGQGGLPGCIGLGGTWVRVADSPGEVTMLATARTAGGYPAVVILEAGAFGVTLGKPRCHPPLPAGGHVGGHRVHVGGWLSWERSPPPAVEHHRLTGGQQAAHAAAGPQVITHAGTHAGQSPLGPAWQWDPQSCLCPLGAGLDRSINS